MYEIDSLEIANSSSELVDLLHFLKKRLASCLPLLVNPLESHLDWTGLEFGSSLLSTVLVTHLLDLAILSALEYFGDLQQGFGSVQTLLVPLKGNPLTSVKLVKL